MSYVSVLRRLQARAARSSAVVPWRFDALALGLVLALLLTAAPALAQSRSDLIRPGTPDRPLNRFDRIVMLGDSIIDGGTLQLLIAQALRDAGKPVPTFINAGVSGDTTAGVLNRLTRDVLPHRPTLVILLIGVNDAGSNVSTEAYERQIDAIVRHLGDRNIPLLILTPTIVGPTESRRAATLADYTAALHRIVARHGCGIHDITSVMRDAADDTQLLEPDAIHLSFSGYRVVAHALLNALNLEGTPVPHALKLAPMPGLITNWRIKDVPEKAPPLEAGALRALRPDQRWTDYTLPEEGPATHWLEEQERQRGVAVLLGKQLKATRFVACTEIPSDSRRRVYFNTGGDIKAIWLNGARVFRAHGWTGQHPGKERIAVELDDADNRVVIETGPTFFLSVTDDDRW